MAYGQFRRRNFRSFPQNKTKIKCAECGKEDEVPFEPRPGSRVLCGDCFRKSKGLPAREKREEPEETKEESTEEIEESKDAEEESDE